MDFQKIAIFYSANIEFAVMRTQYSISEIAEILEYLLLLEHAANPELNHGNIQIELSIENIVETLERFYGFKHDRTIPIERSESCYCKSCDGSCEDFRDYGIFKKTFNGCIEPLKYKEMLDTPQRAKEYYVKFDIDDILQTLDFEEDLQSNLNKYTNLHREGVRESIRAYSDEGWQRWFAD